MEVPLYVTFHFINAYKEQDKDGRVTAIIADCCEHNANATILDKLRLQNLRSFSGEDVNLGPGQVGALGSCPSCPAPGPGLTIDIACLSAAIVSVIITLSTICTHIFTDGTLISFTYDFPFSFSFSFSMYLLNQQHIGKSKGQENPKVTSFTAEMKPLLSSPTSSSVLRKARFSPYLFTSSTFVVFIIVLYSEDFRCIGCGYLGSRPNLSPGPTPIAGHRDQRVSKGKGLGPSCPMSVRSPLCLDISRD